MTRNYVLIIILQICWLYALLCCCKNFYLFGITPSKDLAGFQIDSSCNGKASAVSFPVEGMTILKDCKLISYDSSSNLVLVERNSGLIQQTVLCENGLYYHKSLLNSSSLVYLEDPQGWVCYNGKVRTFALYKSRLYFIVVGTFEDKLKRKATKIELRVMLSCTECGAPNISHFQSFGELRSPFLFNCSKRIAEVYNSRLNGDKDVRIKTGHTLKIVHNNGYLSFFFQVFLRRNFTTTDSEYDDLNLYHATERGTVQLLHTEKIPKHYGRWKINGVAGLDYKDGELCWSTADRIYCGQFIDERLKRSTLVLYPGETVTSGVCKGNRPDLLPIVTGISIIEVLEQEITLAFGCYAQWLGLGGAGLLKISPDLTKKQVHPIYLEYMRHKLRLGSLFTTTYLANYCPPYEGLPMCDDQAKPHLLSTRHGKNSTKSNRTIQKSQLSNNHYSREAQYTIIRASNKTEIGILDYSDLYNDSIVVSKQDRELFDEKGIGGGSKITVDVTVYMVTTAIVMMMSQLL